MKKPQLVIGIPALVIILVIVAAFVIRATRGEFVPGDNPSGYQLPFFGGTRPSGGFGGGSTATEDLVKDLQTTVDDGGESEFDSLKKEASGL